MTIQECRKFLQDKEYIQNNLVPLYAQETDKLSFAKFKILHQFFLNGIQKKYHMLYLETFCSLLDQVCNNIFSSEYASSNPDAEERTSTLVHYALLPDLEDLLINLQLTEVIFTTLEEYEVCANIAYLSQKVKAEIARKRAW